MKTLDLKLYCDLGDEELRQRGQEMADAMREHTTVENDRRLAVKDFKERLEEIRGRMFAAAGAIRDKGEYRLVRCTVQFHVPANGWKRLVRMDTGELVKEEAMTPAEMQLNLYTEAVLVYATPVNPDPAPPGPSLADSPPTT